MVCETAQGKIEAVPVKGKGQIGQLNGELSDFLKNFDIDIESFSRNTYFILGRFIDGENSSGIAFIFVKKKTEQIEFFCSRELKTDRKVFELASKAWRHHFKST